MYNSLRLFGITFFVGAALFTLSMQSASAATSTDQMMASSAQFSATQKCTDGKAWRYKDYDFDKLGNPSKKKRLCRTLPKEGYVRNRKDKNDRIAQFEFFGQKRGWIKVKLYDEDRTYYRFRAFNTPKVKKKKVKVVRYNKFGENRNQLVALHPKGKSLKFIDYSNGFAWHTKKFSNKKWGKKNMMLHDFNGDDRPEVVVLLKNGSTVQVKVVRFVSGKGFTKVAKLNVKDAADVVLKKTQLNGSTDITLVNAEENLEVLLTFDTEAFELMESARAE